MSVCLSLRSLSESQKKRMLEDLKIENGNFFSKETKSAFYFYYIEENTIRIPYYYAYHFLKDVFPNRKINYIRIAPYDMTEGFQLRKIQEEAFQIAKKHYSITGTCFFNSYCAFGKTVVGAHRCMEISKKYKVLSVICCPLEAIADSWLETFRLYTTAKVVKWKKGDPLTPDIQVIVCLSAGLEHLPPNIGHLILDEAHTFCTQGNIKGILNISPLFITALTATYERDDKAEKMIDLLVGPSRVQVISQKPFFVFRYDTNIEPDSRLIRFTKNGVQYESILNALNVNTDRNNLILKLIIKNIDHKMMWLFFHKDQVYKMADLTKKCFQALNINKTVSTYTGDDKKKYENADVLFATASKAGTGFDELGGCNNWDGRRISLLGLGYSTLKPEQLVGRVQRSDLPIVIDLVDRHRNLVNHYNNRERYYISRNAIILKVDHSEERSCQTLIDKYWDSFLDAKEKESSVRATEIVKQDWLPSLKLSYNSSDLDDISREFIQ
jgi:hypothetical protein